MTGVWRISSAIIFMCFRTKNFPIHLQPYIRELFGMGEGMLPVTEDVAKRTIALPFHTGLSLDEVEYVAEALKRAAG